jgi:hypothetical protein
MEDIRWSAPEYHYYEKDGSWYWAVIIIAGVIIAFALWQENFLFAVFTLIAGMLVIAWGKREPRMIDFTLSETGLTIEGKKSFPFVNLSGFAIIPDPDHEEFEELILQTKGKLNSLVKIIIAKQRHDVIYASLKDVLPEIEYEASLADHIVRILKF